VNFYRSKADLIERLEKVSGNAPFAEAEQEQISAQVKEIRAFITAMQELTADQLADVDERLANIEETSKRLGRKDWLMASVGAVFSLVLTDLITPSVAQRILLMMFEGLGHLFGIGGPPAPLP
jgi:hypothetical protein